MFRKIIDLSVPLIAGIASDPPAFLPEITYVTNREGAAQLAGNFPGLTVAELPRGEGGPLNSSK